MENYHKLIKIDQINLLLHQMIGSAQKILYDEELSEFAHSPSQLNNIQFYEGIKNI